MVESHHLLPPVQWGARPETKKPGLLGNKKMSGRRSYFHGKEKPGFSIESPHRLYILDRFGPQDLPVADLLAPVVALRLMHGPMVIVGLIFGFKCAPAMGVNDKRNRLTLVVRGKCL
jgi:hypothetical protein